MWTGKQVAQAAARDENEIKELCVLYRPGIWWSPPGCEFSQRTISDRAFGALTTLTFSRAVIRQDGCGVYNAETDCNQCACVRVHVHLFSPSYYWSHRILSILFFFLCNGTEELEMSLKKFFIISTGHQSNTAFLNFITW